MADRVLDWIDDRDPTQLFVSIAGCLLIVGSTVFVILAASPEPPIERLIGPTRWIPQPTQSAVAYRNPAGGYGFTYPASWELIESGERTRLENPSGGVVLSFGIGTSGGLRATTSRLTGSLVGSPSDQELIGSRRDTIGGSRSLLTSGIGESLYGRPVRFLAVAIAGEPDNYGISIVVPLGSDPNRLLPILEGIVTSFEVLGPETGPGATDTGLDFERMVELRVAR